MQGVAEFLAFCHDEFWDVDVTQIEWDVVVGLPVEDPRHEMLCAFLWDVWQDTGIVSFVALRNSIVVMFDECGAAYPSMVFKLRTSFVNPEHRAAAVRRDRRDQLEMLGIYAATRKPFTRKMVHPAIRRIQLALGEAGYETLRDGRWDRKTRYALWRFRRKHHLSTPGYITQETLDALEV